MRDHDIQNTHGGMDDPTTSHEPGNSDHLAAPHDTPPQLIVYRPSPALGERQARQNRNGTYFLVGLYALVVLGTAVYQSPTSVSHNLTLSPILIGFFAFTLLAMQPLVQAEWLRTYRRGRVVLGRDGLLLLPSLPSIASGKRRTIAWHHITAIEPAKGMMLGALNAFTLRTRRGTGANVTLRPWQYEVMTPGALPRPNLDVAAALNLYWRAPERRAALAPLPAPAQEASIAELVEPASAEAPAVRWLSVPAWAALIVLAGTLLLRAIYTFMATGTPDARRLLGIWARPATTARALFSVWVYPDTTGGPPYSALAVALVVMGLALLLARGNRRGWGYIAGGLVAVAGLALQALLPLLLGADAYADMALLPQLLQPKSGDWLFWAGFSVVLALRFAVNRDAEARGYRVEEAMAWSAVALLFSLAPGITDLALLPAAPTPLAALELAKDLLAWPHLALAALVLCVFQGHSVRSQRRATLGVLLCGVGMALVVPGLYLAASWWEWTSGWIAVVPTRDAALSGAFVALHLLGGAVIALGAWQHLARLPRVAPVVAQPSQAAPQPDPTPALPTPLPMPLPALPARIGPPRLLVFRQTARARQFSERFLRLFLLMFGGMSLLMFVLFAAIFLLAPGHPETSVALSALGFTLGMFVLMVPPLLVPLWLRRREASQRNRTARIALGREGILLTAGALDPRVARPDLIVPWDALAKVDLNVQTSGVFAALFVRRGAGLRLSRLLRVRSLLLGSRANLMLPSPLYERIMPDGQVGSPLPALPLGEALLYQANEPSAVDSPLMPSLTLAEALHWYSREPGRRAELAPLPPLESAQERIALELPAESASPAGRAIGVAAWAALALFAALLAEPLLVAALWPGHGHFTVYGVVMVVLTCGGLALVLAGGRGWRYALGGLGLVAGIVMQFVTRIVLDLPGSLDVTPRYVASPIPLGPSTPGWLLYAWIGVMAFAMAWAFVAVMQTRGWITRRRGPGPGYGANEVLAFAALVVVYALAPAAFDTLQLMAPQVFLGAAPAADLLLLPGLPALVLALAYLQGRARRVRLLTSGGMLVCGVLMLLAPLAVWLVATPRAMPGLDATHTGSVLLVYAALAVVAGALVAAEALWRLARGANEPPAATPS